jgi:UDP-galactopyranose mutase
MYDEIDANGILVQRYGPHAFHTNEKEVFDFITGYDDWVDYKLNVAVVIGTAVTPTPANFKTIDLLYDREEAGALKTRIKTLYAGQKTAAVTDLLKCEDADVSQYAQKLFELNYRPYTVKQWGIPPEEIDPSVLKRVPVRLDYTDGYFDDTYQCLPKNGFTNFFRNLLNHKNIEVLLDTDALNMIKVDVKNRRITFENKPILIPVVYTGAIDELLDYRYGPLPYRSLRFDFQTINTDSFQDAPLVAHPGAEGYTRITEYKKIPVQNISGFTTVAYEYPLPANKVAGNEPYYPILTGDNVSLYDKYNSGLNCIPNLFLCGRLADYKYYNMDAAIMRAFDVFKNIMQTDNKNVFWKATPQNFARTSGKRFFSSAYSK